MVRYQRVAEAIRQEVSMIVHDKLKDPRIGFITITGVELTQDMRYAKIFYSVLGKDEDYRKTQEALDSALGFIRHLVAERIRLRFAPEIVFKQDRSSEYSIRIQEVLQEIKGLDGSPQAQEAVPEKKPRKEKRRGPPKNSRRSKNKK
ncbi:MAG: 30S ribosome-binding factor RbfA [Candidatus Omnitrophica bacterium]|nr:30S ribosome-binding factor RbfA [Candidatus Omnitrophota bacterium]